MNLFGKFYLIMFSLNLHQIKRFIISGSSSTALHYITMGLLIFLGIDAIWATSIGAILGAICNYVLQYYYTFRSDRKHRYSLQVYLISSLLAWLSNLLLFMLFHKILEVSVIIAQLVTTLIITLQNFIMYKKLVFVHIIGKTKK